jgi:glucose-6-phosphate isomerase
MNIENGSFPLEWDAQECRLYAEGKKLEPQARTLKEMLPVLYDRQWAKAADSKRAYYYMHRDVHKAADKSSFSRHRRRYDVTVVPPATLGMELVKTIGHYHELSPAKGHLSFPELYEVLAGTAHFLLFKRKVVHGADADSRIEDALLLEAKAGQKAFMPPNYGHIMINPGKDVLVTSNLVEWKFKSLYEPVGKMAGGPYFELSDGSLVPNPRYSSLPVLKKVEASRHAPTAALGLGDAKPVYDLYAENPKRFAFLEP